MQPYVRLCRAMWDCVDFCTAMQRYFRAMYSYVGLRSIMQGCVELSNAMQSYVWLCRVVKGLWGYLKHATSGLLSMLHSDWFCYYQAICYSPLLAKSASFENQDNGVCMAMYVYVQLYLSTENVFCLHSSIKTREGLGEFETAIQTRDDSSRVCITVENSPNASSVYSRPCKHRK